MTQYEEQVRREVIGARPSDIMPWLINFRLWRWWSPWEDLDPRMRRWYRGLMEGVGARYEWAGNRRAGSAHLEITDVRPDSVELDVAFKRPFRTHSIVRFELLELRDSTNVVWTMRSPRTLGTRLVGVVMNVDEALGRDLERGLSRLKELVESGAEPTT